MVKFFEGTENQLFFSPFTNMKTIDLFSVRRDVNSNATLRTATAVKLTAAPGLLADFNEENDETFEWLPDSLYTLVSNSTIQKTSDGYMLNFGSGDFAKELSIQLNGAKWDISHKYAVAYTITDASGLPIKSGGESILAFISVKNKYDGVYAVTGTMQDFANPALVTVNNDPAGSGLVMEYTLQTASPTKCLVVDNVIVGGVATPIWTGTGYSYFGSFGLVIEFDPVTDKVVAVTNYFGQPAGNTRSAQLDPSGVNAYDPSTKTIQLKYWMIQPSVIAAAPHIRTAWDEEWKFVRER
nr:DUF1735 domain-containing protein [Rhabdobacter roseus]